MAFCQHSSEAEQLFCKQWVGGSNPSAGSNMFYSLANSGFSGILPLNAEVAEWTIAADCKSVAIRLRRFESYPRHTFTRASRPFSMEESLSHRTLKNALWQVFNLGWLTILNFFATPILLKRFGLENYGVYVLILTMFTFLSLLDFGMGAGFSYGFIEYTVKKDDAARARLVSTFLAFWACVGVAGLLFFTVSSFFTGSLFGVKDEFVRQAQIGFLFAGGYFLLAMISSLFLAMASAIQRFDIIGKAIFVQNTALNALLVLVALMRPSLSWVMASHFFAAALAAAVYVVLLKRELPWLQMRIRFHPSEFFRKFGFSAFNSVCAFANSSLLQVDRFFVSRMLGNTQLSLYAVPNNLAQKIYSISASGAMTLFPVSSALSHGKERERMKRGFRRAMKFSLLFSVIAGTVMLAFGKQLLLFWVGKDIATIGTGLLYYFVPIYVLMSVYTVVSSFYLGTGDSRIMATFSAGMALVNVALLAILVPRFGITGAAAAYLAAVLPVLGFWAMFEIRVLKDAYFVRAYTGLFLKLALVCLPFWFFARTILAALAVNLVAVLTCIAGSFTGIIVLYWFFGFFDSEDKELIRAFTFSVIKGKRN